MSAEMAGGASSAAAAQRVGAALSADADFKVVAVALAGLMNILRTGELEAQAAVRVEQAQRAEAQKSGDGPDAELAPVVPRANSHAVFVAEIGGIQVRAFFCLFALCEARLCADALLAQSVSSWAAPRCSRISRAWARTASRRRWCHRAWA